MKDDIRVESGTLGLITGEEKRVLECYIDPRFFRQRKQFDEYYVDTTNLNTKLDLKDLMILAESFKVRVLDDCVMISGK